MNKFTILNLAISLGFVVVVLIFDSMSLNFHKNYTINLLSLNFVQEVKSRMEFSELNFYKNDLFILHPLFVKFCTSFSCNEFILKMLFSCLTIVAKFLIAETLNLGKKSHLIFTLFYLLNPFLYKQIIELDTRIFDLFLIALFLKLKKTKQSILLKSFVMGILIYLRIQNVIFMSVYVEKSNSKFIKILLGSFAFTALFIFGSGYAMGDYVQ